MGQRPGWPVVDSDAARSAIDSDWYGAVDFGKVVRVSKDYTYRALLGTSDYPIFVMGFSSKWIMRWHSCFDRPVRSDSIHG